MSKASELRAYLESVGWDDTYPSGNRATRCPFHNDTIKSASIHGDKGVFHCFTCGLSGDAIALIQHVEGIGYRDAAARIEVIAGTSGDRVRESDDGTGSFLPGLSRPRRGNSRTLPSWKRADTRDWA